MWTLVISLMCVLGTLLIVSTLIISTNPLYIPTTYGGARISFQMREDLVLLHTRNQVRVGCCSLSHWMGLLLDGIKPSIGPVTGYSVIVNSL